MGPNPSKQLKNIIVRDYNILYKKENENITYLQEKRTGEEYILRQMNFGDKKLAYEAIDKLEGIRGKLKGCQHVVTLQSFQVVRIDQYCSTFYRVCALYKYPLRTLEDQINQRNLHNRKFTETELWSILASCIVGMSHLQKNHIQHSALRCNNILISQSGMIQVYDPYITATPTNINTILANQNTQKIYLSPQQIAIIQDQNPKATNNYKNDIWTLGMIILQAGLLQSQDECYRDNHSRIHWQTLQYNIKRFGEYYSEDIKNMVEFMLNQEFKERPDWIQLEEHVGKNDQIRKSMASQQVKSMQEGQLQNSLLFTGPISLSNNHTTTNNFQKPLNPIKISSIESSRPFRNIFPQPFYIDKTKFDENVQMVNIFDGSSSHSHDQSRSASSNANSKVALNTDLANQDQSMNSSYKYVEEKFKIGSKYFGYKKNGMRHGRGKFYYQDGAMYDGRWYQNKMQGYGKLYYQSGKLAYEGYWHSDQFSGKGVIYNEIPDELQGSFDYHNMQDINGCWVKYEGEFSQDMKNGYGVLELSNGQKFQGNFEDDTISGHGIFHKITGETIKGHWQNNIKTS